MTVFPPHSIHINLKELNNISNAILDDLPNSITKHIDEEVSQVTYEGMTAKLTKNNKINNDLSLGIHKSIDSGKNFGVMVKNHKDFTNTFSLNLHEVNFNKERDTFCIGSTIYTANIRRYVKEMKDTYTLQFKKGSGVRSPLFVPYLDEFFLVLEPLNDEQSDNPPLIVDDDGDVGGKSVAEYNQSKLDEYHNSDIVEEVMCDEGLAMLFATPSGSEAIYVNDEQSFHNEVLNSNTTAIVVHRSSEPSPEPEHDYIKDFLDKHPNAGQKLKVDELFNSRPNTIVFTKDKIKTYSREKSKIGQRTLTIWDTWFDEKTNTFRADQGLSDEELLTLNEKENKRGVKLTDDELEFINQDIFSISINDNISDSGLPDHENHLEWRGLTKYEEYCQTLDFFEQPKPSVSKREVKLFASQVHDETYGIEVEYNYTDLFKPAILSESALANMLEQYAKENFNTDIGELRYFDNASSLVSRYNKMKTEPSIDTRLTSAYKSKQTHSQIPKLKTLIEQVNNSKYRRHINVNRRENTLEVIPTEAYSNKFIAEAKRLKLDFISYEAKPDDELINSVPELVRRQLKHVGYLIDLNDKIDMYTFKDRNWREGKKLIHSLIMANYDKLYYTIQNSDNTVLNRAIDVKNQRSDEWYYVGDYKYPKSFIEPYIKNKENKHGLYICKEVSNADGRTSLFIPYGDVTLTVGGIPKFNVTRR